MLSSNFSQFTTTHRSLGVGKKYAGSTQFFQWVLVFWLLWKRCWIVAQQWLAAWLLPWRVLWMQFLHICFVSLLSLHVINTPSKYQAILFWTCLHYLARLINYSGCSEGKMCWETILKMYPLVSIAKLVIFCRNSANLPRCYKGYSAVWNMLLKFSSRQVIPASDARTCLTHWGLVIHVALEILVNTGSGNGLLPDGTKPFTEPIVTHHQ